MTKFKLIDNQLFVELKILFFSLTRNLIMLTNDQETPSPLSQQTRSTQAGRPYSEVWNHFSKIQVKNSKGHYSAKCNYCTKSYNRGEPQKLLAHLANHCISCDSQTRKKCLEELNNKTKANLQKNPNISGQTNISSFYESTVLTKERENSINRSLIKAFVCCNIPFHVIEHPYFIDFLKQLQPAYQPPSRKVLSQGLLDIEVGNVNQKINSILEKAENLTLGKN